MAQWIGYMVSIKCSDDNSYQGEISAATSKEIKLIKAFCNGVPSVDHEITITANQIQELKLIDKQSSSPQQRSTVTIAKPIAKRAGRTQSTSEATNISLTNSKGSHNTNTTTTNNNNNNNSINNNNISRSKPIDIEISATSTTMGYLNKNNSHLNESNSYKNGTPNKREKNKNKHTKGWKDEECFGSPLDHKINKDFDFEKNLALFDKQAVWDEINSLQKPDVIKNLDNRKSSKYRHDENVIAAAPMTYRQIIVPKQDFCEYVTDDGLIIPSISRSLRRKLFEAADRVGLTFDKRIELLGRAASEISIQLLGGGHRLNPHNLHQIPTVVVLCGPHKQGAVGVNAARQLASHGVQTVVFTISSEIPIIKKELQLYNLTKNPLIHHIKDLPNFTDLIIVALCEDTENPKNYPDICDWANRNRAPILAIDPPSVGTPGIKPKFSLLPVLPLPHSSRNGKLYLCNLGFPVEIFNEVGIKYKSPFGSKFVIPLHPKDD